MHLRAGGSRRPFPHWPLHFLAPPLAILLAVHAAAIASAESYVVQPGDTLTAIAAQAGVDVDTLVALNELPAPDLIVVGSALLLSVDPPVPLPTAEPPPAYTVQPGDTLLGISLLYDVPVERLVDLNGLAQADFIVAGQTLHLPAPPAPPTPTPTPSPSPTPVPTTTPTRQPTASATRPPPTATPRATSTSGPTSTPRATPNIGNAPTPATPPRVVQVALQYLGSPYAFAGVSPAGFDCSGFTYFAQEQAGRPIPRDIFGQYDVGSHPTGPLQPGDLVFFENTTEPGLSHVGIYLGGARFVHAIDEARGVGISTITDEYWRTRWYGAVRLS